MLSFTSPFSRRELPTSQTIHSKFEPLDANKFVRATIRLAGQLAIGVLLRKASKLEGSDKVLHEWEEDLVNERLS